MSTQTQTQGYIMLSYQWDHQEVVLKIRDRLEEECYKVWIDVKKMKGFIYSALSKAVKEADLVLACLSQKYEESEKCESECGCIKLFKRPYIPLMMEKYELNGWVAGIFGEHIYVNFSNAATFDDKFKELLMRLQDYPSLKPQVPNPDLPPIPPTEAASASAPPANPAIQHSSSDTPNTEDPNSMRDIPHRPTSSDTPDTPNTEEPQKIPELSQGDFLQLLVDVSPWWTKNGNVNRLKVLLYEFKEIPLTRIEENERPIDLLMLLRPAGLISRLNIDVLLDTAVLGGLHDVDLEEVIRKTVPTFQGFSKVVILKFSKHRRNLIEFGKAIGQNDKDLIVTLWELTAHKQTDIWGIIFELEIQGILTENEKESFIKKLTSNKMKVAVTALTTF